MEALFILSPNFWSHEKNNLTGPQTPRDHKPPPQKNTQTATRAATKKPVVLPKNLMTVENFAGLF